MNDIDVTLHRDHAYDHEYAALVRGNLIHINRPHSMGGAEAVATPTELFLANLAASVANAARRYLARHGVPGELLEVAAIYDTGDRPPSWIRSIDVHIRPQAVIPEQHRAGLIAVARSCVIHNSMVWTPDIRVDLDLPVRAA
ncbi:MAG TPA: OsmC family protein [Streptosporangiaceae bacterium]